MSDQTGIAFESEVLASLSSLSTGQNYITKTVDGIQQHLEALNGSVRDLYTKHYAVDKAVDAVKADVATASAVTASKAAKHNTIAARWYHWCILITGSSLATALGTALLKILHLIR